jgi:signal transduction histidine kinase
VILEISDNGHGIPPADSNRLFDPFFTTKATGVGTGLGLSVARRIVELHGGELTLENRTKEPGAVARLILPTKLETAKVRTVTGRVITEPTPKEIDSPPPNLTS